MLKTLTQLVEIMPDGMAKELNPFGARPKYNLKRSDLPYIEKHHKKFNDWQTAEANRMVFKIDFYKSQVIGDNPPYTYLNLDLIVGDIVTAECNLEDMTCIIK